MSIEQVEERVVVLQDIKKVKSFELKLDVRKTDMLLRQKETDPNAYPQWLLNKKRHIIAPCRSGNDLKKVSEYIREFANIFEGLVNQDTAIGYRSKLTSKKTKDGYGGILIGASAYWYEVKSDVAIEKYIRSEIKKEIEAMYHDWVKSGNVTPVKIPYSQVLPSNLLSKLMDSEINIHDFFIKLHQLRHAADASRGIKV